MGKFGRLHRVRGMAAAALAFGCGSRSGLELEVVSSPDTQALPAFPAPMPIPPAPARSGCVDVTRSYSSEPATVMLLIDQSGSMTARFGGSTRWDVLRQAIVDPDKGLLAWLDKSARVGLMLYSSLDGSLRGNSCPLLTEVPIAIGDIDQVRSAYLAAQPLPRGDTPTGESIDQAVQRLTQMQSDAPKYLLVLTDGDPDTCAQPNPQLGMPQAIAAVQNAIAQGVRRVYTVGVSEDISGANLQAMANAGAGKDPGLVYGKDAAAEQPLFASTDPEQLASQLEGVIGDIRTCTISLRQWAGAGRGLDGRISLDGQVLEFGSADGWSFVDDDTLRIHGTACQKILGDGQKLQITFPCVDDVPPSEIPR